MWKREDSVILRNSTLRRVSGITAILLTASSRNGMADLVNNLGWWVRSVVFWGVVIFVVLYGTREFIRRDLAT